jgi:hypothetical protein
MAKPTNISAPPSRIRTVLIGVGVGAAWGAIMWAIMSALHQNASLQIFLYLVFTTAMIGGGVAAFFGAAGVRRGGDRVTPRIRRRDR